MKLGVNFGETICRRKKPQAARTWPTPTSISLEPRRIAMTSIHISIQQHVDHTCFSPHHRFTIKSETNSGCRRVLSVHLLSSLVAVAVPSLPRRRTTSPLRSCNARHQLEVEFEAAVSYRHDLAVDAPAYGLDHARWRHDFAAPRNGTTVTPRSHARHHRRSVAEPEGPRENP